jgi:hypothetical protein
MAEWVAYDMPEVNEQAKTEELVARDLKDYDLPFIGEDDFKYYPKLYDLPCNDDMASTEAKTVLGGGIDGTGLIKQKHWLELWLEKTVPKLRERLRLKQ